MKERPILFSSHMVRAILDGTKSQTRRTLKDQPGEFVHVDFNDARGWHLWWDCCESCGNPDVWQEYADLKCPYGNQGDRLWVRETFSVNTAGDEACYRATLPPLENAMIEKWKPSIFMPRWASRITLEITEIRAERLQDISEEDAKAEGVSDKGYHKMNYDDRKKYDTIMKYDWGRGAQKGHYTVGYRIIWEAINGYGSWDKNPWVWVIEFKRIAALEDKVKELEKNPHSSAKP